MGKLQEALTRVKEAGSTRTGESRRTRPIEGVEISAKDDREIWPSLVQYECDGATMHQHGVIVQEQHTAGPVMAYNMLRTRIIKRMRDNKWASMLVTSPDPGAGKSVTVLNLALSIAREQNQRVYLVDADFRRPSLHAYLGVQPKMHLTNYLDGECELDDVVSSIGFDRLFTVFNTVQHEHSADLLTSPRMRRFIHELRERDPDGLIVFDSPPLLLADDVLAFSPQVDAIVLVVAEGETPREDLDRSLRLLTEINLVGVVLNKSRDFSHGAYY